MLEEPEDVNASPSNFTRNAVAPEFPDVHFRFMLVAWVGAHKLN